MSDIEDDPFTRCIFQQQNDNGEWENYLIVGEYRLSKLSEVLAALLKFDGRVQPDGSMGVKKNEWF